MRIVLATGTMDAAGWRDALARAFAEAGLDFELHVWDGRPIGAHYAIVWLPPAELFAAEPDLRVAFNLGAGVDALLARGVVPARLPIVRLVDAGMGAKIAEYVCFAIARITRGLERFGPPPHGLRDWNASRPRPVSVIPSSAGRAGRTRSAASKRSRVRPSSRRFSRAHRSSSTRFRSRRRRRTCSTGASSGSCRAAPT
jgi:hypothetical protein